MEAIRNLIEQEQLHPVIDSVLPLNQVAKAHQHLERGGVKGKIVLEISEN
jgi:NADPH:quinone reductase